MILKTRKGMDLFMKFNNLFSIGTKNKTLFLDPSSSDTHYQYDTKVDIILSPSLYWVKKLSLPVKYISDVIKLLPSIFEESLPDGNYSYYAYKSGDFYFAFAYEDKLIIDEISKKGILLSNVSDVYFAQSELNHTKGAISISESLSLYVKDELVVLVPSEWAEEKNDLDISQITLSKNRVILQQFGHIVDRKSFYSIFGILAIFILLAFSELYITNKKSQDILELKNELFAKNSLKPTMMQNRVILKKYLSTHNKQIKIREYISHLLSLRLKSNEKITLINLKNTKLLVNFSSTNSKTLMHVTKSLKAKGLKFTSKHKDNTLHLEIQL